jgi:hypothetical protein
MSTEADKQYLKKHGIPLLFNEVTQELFKDRPENPVAYIIDLLKKKKAEGAAAPVAAAADDDGKVQEEPAAAANDEGEQQQPAE